MSNQKPQPAHTSATPVEKPETSKSDQSRPPEEQLGVETLEERIAPRTRSY